MSNTTIGKTIILFVLLIIAGVMMFSDFDNSRGVTYDCGMAEWHPDIPNSVREECRRIRYEQWKKEHDQKISTPRVQHEV